MAIEVTVFDPDSMYILLKRDLPAGLRELADAIEAKQIDGVLWDCQGNGLVNWRDTRAHIMVKLDLAADVRKFRRFEDAPKLGAGDGLEKVI